MAGKLLKEIHKTTPFESVQQEVFLNVLRTADHLRRAWEECLKAYNLSLTQYNVLRILRNQTASEALRGLPPPCPSLPCKNISEQMITRDPDITRLLDRLEARGLITRQRDVNDRRVVMARITDEGLKTLTQLDKIALDFHQRPLAHMPTEKLQQLVELLEAVRAGVPLPETPPPCGEA